MLKPRVKVANRRQSGDTDLADYDVLDPYRTAPGFVLREEGSSRFGGLDAERSEKVVPFRWIPRIIIPVRFVPSNNPTIP